MKSIFQSSLKLASLALVLLLGVAATAKAQGGRLEMGQLDQLAAKASQTVDVNIDERLMRLTLPFLSGKDPDEAKIREVINGLKGIYVKSFEFEHEGEYSQADIEGIRAQLRNPAWSRIVNVNSKKEGSVEVYLMTVGARVEGLAVLAVDPKEVTIVNIIGPVDLEKLTKLEGQFGVPELGIEVPKTKTKN
jgi:uncharacterized protein DUF4252